MKFIAYSLLAVSVALASALAADKYLLPKRAPQAYAYATTVQSPVQPTRTSKPTQPSQEKLEVVTLSSKNMVIMDSVFTDESVSQVMLDIQKLSEALPHDATIYLVLNSPGGSVMAGNRMLSFIKALPQKTKTLTLFAASMGFQTVQGLDERLILDTGTLMSHRGSFGCQGEAEGEIESCMNWIMSMFNEMDAIAAQRMGMTVPAYKELIRDEYWVYGRKAVQDKAADRAVLAKCDKTLSGTRIVPFETMIGTFNVEMSKCPLIPGFLSVKYVGASTDVNAINEYTKYIKTLGSNKRRFVDQYIVNNKWSEYQK